jgi:MFS transporter, DHA1 family, multidrug resistance protein
MMNSGILRFPYFLIVALMGSFPAIAAVLFTPALPNLAQYFQVSDSAVKTTMSTYLLGYAIGILLYGPIANRWGRKKAVLGGFSLAFIATLLCLWAGTMKFF